MKPMANVFNYRYRIPSARAQWWNYGNNGAYFITICTLNRQHFFGEIFEDEMYLSVAGIKCWECWKAIPDHFPFVELGAFIVMPNHVHGIIIIDKPTVRTHQPPDGGQQPPVGGQQPPVGGQQPPVETQNFASLQENPRKQQRNQFGPQSQNLGSIVRGFKIGVTVFCRNNNFEFQWQARFHDHIIRDHKELERIHHYIVNNPKNWKEDVHYL
jgi:putative transposase